MILHVANPIYDSVFKYIMSDERIYCADTPTERAREQPP